jgi:hypothetical protein
MSRDEIVDEIRNRLRGANRFKISREGRGFYTIGSDRCNVLIYFERFGSDFNVLLSDPRHPDMPGMALYLLRFLTAASEGKGKRSDGEFIADLINKYMSNILDGDFSIQKQYYAIEDAFYSLIMDARKLPLRDPVRKKIEEFDISWIDEYIRRE